MIEFWVLLLVTIEQPTVKLVNVDVELESYTSVEECLEAREEVVKDRTSERRRVSAACVKSYLFNSTPKDYNH